MVFHINIFLYVGNDLFSLTETDVGYKSVCVAYCAKSIVESELYSFSIIFYIFSIIL